VAVPGEQPNAVTIADNDQAETIVFDFQSELAGTLVPRVGMAG
jgi:hypothetical protein